MDNREQIRQIISKRLRLKNDHAGFSDSDSLFLSRRMDSLDSIEVILFLEERFGVNFKASGFDQLFIDSVDAMVRLIPVS